MKKKDDAYEELFWGLVQAFGRHADAMRARAVEQRDEAIDTIKRVNKAQAQVEAVVRKVQRAEKRKRP